MQFSPSLDESPLLLRQRSCQKGDGFDSHDGNRLLVLCVKMRRVMACEGSANIRMMMPWKHDSSGMR